MRVAEICRLVALSMIVAGFATAAKSDDQAAQPAKAAAAKTRANAPFDFTLLTPPPEFSGGSKSVVVVTAHEVGPDTAELRRGLLLREIGRQALLLAARQELGLATADPELGETAPTEDDAPVAPLGVVTIAQKSGPLRLLVFRRSGEQFETIFDESFSFDDATGEEGLLEAWTARAERLARERFPTVLKQAGFTAKPRASDGVEAKVAVDDAVETLLATPTFATQFSALRQLRRAIAKQGESPQLLAALVRGYANLGLLTEFHWSPAHKAYKARALLYAERLLTRQPRWAEALYARAYARAMTGLHSAALADLKQAQRLAADQNVKSPEWAPLVEAYCRWDTAQLEQAADDNQLTAWARLWALLTMNPVQKAHIDGAAGAAIRVTGDCYRAIDAAGEVNTVENRAEVATRLCDVLSLNLYDRLSAMDDLPQPVRKLVAQQTQGPSGGIFSDLFGPPDRAAAERVIRARVIDALAQCNRSANHEAEPQWAALSQMISEVSFVHVWRQLDYDRYWVNASPVVTMLENWPLIARHPRLFFLKSFTDDEKLREKHLDAWIPSLPLHDLELHESGFWNSLETRKPVALKAVAAGLAHADPLSRDLHLALQVADEERKPGLVKQLLAVTPHAPLAIAAQVDQDAKSVGENTLAWEKQYAEEAVVLAALGRRYARLKQYADAERLFLASIELAPTLENYLSLADVYEARHETAKWLAILEEYLSQTDSEEKHARARQKIAVYYMQRRQWREAQPHCEAATGEKSAIWAQLGVGACAEAQQNWEAAEHWYQSASEMQPDVRVAWYFFCKRTGQGNLEDAQRVALEYVKEHAAKLEKERSAALFGYYMLTGQSKLAVAAAVKDFSVNNELSAGMHAALLADEARDAQQRDELLAQIIAKKATFKTRDGQSLTAVCAVAELIAADLAAGGHGEIDLARADKLLADVEDYPRSTAQFFLARYLDLHGKSAAAVEYWTRSMVSNQLYTVNRTLAGSFLWDRGVTPSAYKTALVSPNPPAKP